MAIKLGVIMDPIGSIQFKKDSTLAMLWEAARRGYELYYFQQEDLFLKNGKAYGLSQRLTVYQDSNRWYELAAKEPVELASLQIILMRKDPPFEREYLYATYVLELAEREGALIVNKPQGLRDVNEKMYTAWFPECCPATLVTGQITLLKQFYQEHQDIVCKPLDAMGGYSIFRLQPQDPNVSVVFDLLTKGKSQYIMAQKFIPQIVAGDKRIILIDGEPVPYALARIPSEQDWRGNLAAGAKGMARPLTSRDQFICEQVGPILRAKGLYFVGLDVIGDYLTEINVTSPTGIRELDEQCGLNISKVLFDKLERYLQAA